MSAGPRGARLARASLALLTLALLSASCAYFNTYYMAKKYYEKATGSLPYSVEASDPGAVANYTKSVEYAKKVIANYPKDRWVDDAYLMWARALIGKEDPTLAMEMLRDFSNRYPKSSLKNEAVFYLGVASRRARKYNDALGALDDFLGRSPHHRLAPYAHLERANALMSLKRPKEAVEAATQVVEHFRKSWLHDRALAARAEALLAAGDAERARADYKTLGTRSRTDEERFTFLLKEADCLEGGRDYAGSLALLRDALSHEMAPAAADTGRFVGSTPLTPSNERYGRLLLRIGTVHLLERRQDEALAAYRRVVSSFARNPLAAEAQYRVGYVYETLADDFVAARTEYAQVRTQAAASPYAAQAAQRLAGLERLAQFRGSGVDSITKKVEAGLLLAELYLFQLDKPERALEEYRKIEEQYPGTPHAAKVMNAQAWVLRNKLNAAGAADSLLWAVVRRFPATEPQLQARDYLEFAGHVVPADLIQMPPTLLARSDTLPELTPPPAATPELGLPFAAQRDSIRRAIGSPGMEIRPPAFTGPAAPGPWHGSPLDDPLNLPATPVATAPAVPDTASRRAPLAMPRPAPSDTGRSRP